MKWWCSILIIRVLDLLCILETCHYYGAFLRHSFLWSIINTFLVICTGCYSMCFQLDRSYNYDWDFQEHVWFTIMSTHCQIQWLFKFHCLFYTKGLFYFIYGFNSKDRIEALLYENRNVFTTGVCFKQKWKLKFCFTFVTLVLLYTLVAHVG